MSHFRLSVIALIGLSFAGNSLTACPLNAQGAAGPPQTVELIEAWVWPAWGDDASGAINDPGQPYKSIQAAIDDLHDYIYVTEDPLIQGLVWCMPGVYGPVAAHGSSASNDAFPIEMRHKVHVRGVSARRCVIRGIDPSNPAYFQNTHFVSMPYGSFNCSADQGKVGLLNLLTFRQSDKYRPARNEDDPSKIPWWAYQPEVDEILDGFTFQGGDVQVAFEYGQNDHYPQSGRVSNCVFDMRQFPGFEGPEVGLLMSSAFQLVQGSFCGYFNQRVHVVNNTFILAEYTASGWQNLSKFGAVAILNCTDHRRFLNFPDGKDTNTSLRGLGSPGIQNNVIRTAPQNDPVDVGPMAMVGIDASDCLVREAGSQAAFLRTNAFAPQRAGSQSGPIGAPYLVSVPVAPTLDHVVDIGPTQTEGWFEEVYYNAENPTLCPKDCPSLQDPTISYCCATAIAPPSPGVKLWNGAPSPAPDEHDPGFVGEFLTTQQPTPVLDDYADWRVLPGSPVIDMGRLWTINEFANGQVYRDHPHEKLSYFRWDGEGWGNVRVHGSEIDIGFDEFHLGVMAGSYANGSNSHNHTTHLNPAATASQSHRRVLLPSGVNGANVVGATLRVKSVERQAPLPIPPWTPTAWYQPPATLAAPLVDGQLPSGYQTAYINFGAEQWALTIVPSMVLGQAAPAVPIPNYNKWGLVQVNLPADDEGQNFTSHFNSQFVLDGGGLATAVRGNLQPEYR